LSQIFSVKARDRERPISDLTHNLDYPTLESDARRVLATGANVEREVRDSQGRVYMARLRPYHRATDDVSGVVLTFIDMTRIKRAETALRESEQRLEEELNLMRVLHATAVAITTHATIQEALDEFIGAALRLTGADFGDIQLLDADTQTLKISANR